METNFKIQPYNTPRRIPPMYRTGAYSGSGVSPMQMGLYIDRYIERPVKNECSAGLMSFIGRKTKAVSDAVVNYGRNYINNIKHTYEHKLYFSIIEKEIFGKNSIDSLTHDTDKLILYSLGFPKSFVSKFHRKHSVHHTQSGKKPNLRSMLCDNIASSPEFKPEKKQGLRAYYNSSDELKSVKGFGEILNRYNFGENLDFAKIIAIKNKKYNGYKGLAHAAIRALLVMIVH